MPFDVFLLCFIAIVAIGICLAKIADARQTEARAREMEAHAVLIRLRQTDEAEQ